MADEVCSLANRTQESTNEIEQMISKLRDGTDRAVNAMSGGRSKAESNLDRLEQKILS